MRFAATMAGLLGALALAGCGSSNQALLASGGTDDFVAMQHVTEEFGDAAPDATVPVTVGDQEYSFRVWIHKTKPKIMVQTASMAGTAAAGFVRGLTAGLVSTDPEYQPFVDAAMSYLNANRGPGCVLHNSRKITRIGFEWDFECPAIAAPAPPRARKPQPLPR